MIRSLLVLFLATSCAVAVGCTTTFPAAVPCRDIPRNGCPVTEDGSECSDPTCAAAYTCNSGSWTLARVCPGFDAGRSVDAAAPVEAGELCDASGLTAPPGANGGPGCTDLQPPDCPLGQVLFCAPAGSDPCLGCESLFVCQSGDWIPWGECTLEGGVAAAR